MAAPSIEAPSSFSLPILSTRPQEFPSKQNVFKCPTPEGNVKGFAEGKVFELLGDNVNIYTAIKIRPDKKTVITRNKIITVRDEEMGDSVWILPEHPGKEDRSKRFSLTNDDHLQISLFNGKDVQYEFNIHTGLRKQESEPSLHDGTPDRLPISVITGALVAMVNLIENRPYQLSEMQSFINTPRDNKLEDF